MQPPEAWLAEMDLGDWEGRLWAELPEAELTAWTEDFGHYRAGGTGESVGAFLARIEAGLRAERTQTDAQVWITHAGVIRAIHWLLEGRLASQPLPTAQEWPRIEVAFGDPWLLMERHRLRISLAGC